MKLTKTQLKNLIAECLRETTEEIPTWKDGNYQGMKGTSSIEAKNNVPTNIKEDYDSVRVNDEVEIKGKDIEGSTRFNGMVGIVTRVNSEYIGVMFGKEIHLFPKNNVQKTSLLEGEPTWKDGNFKGMNSKEDKVAKSCVPNKIKEGSFVPTLETVREDLIYLKRSIEKRDNQESLHLVNMILKYLDNVSFVKNNLYFS